MFEKDKNQGTEKNYLKPRAGFPLIIGAIGVVYGDLGTSPLYSIRSCFNISGISVNSQNI